MECPKCHTQMDENQSICPNCNWKREIDDPFFTMGTISNNSQALEDNYPEKKATINNQDEIKSNDQDYHLDQVFEDNGKLVNLELMIQKENEVREKIKEIEKNNQKEREQIEFDEYDLLNDYIGKNHEKLEDEGFSFAAFFGGAFYFLYRKFYFFTLIYAFIFILLSIILFFLPVSIEISVILEIIIIFIIQVVSGALFKNRYITHCLKKIRKIMDKYPNHSFPELKSICSNKGGTSILSMIGFSVFLIIIQAAITYVVFIFFKSNMNDFALQLDKLHLIIEKLN